VLARSALFASLCVLAGCVSKGSVEDYLAAVSTGDGAVFATLHAGLPPRASSGPSVNVTTGTALTLTGGSSLLTLATQGSFDRVIVALQGVDGWYELVLPAATDAAEVAFTTSPHPANGSFTMNLATAGAEVGSYTALAYRLARVQAGQVQVSVTWEEETDVDLHVLDPLGEELYYGRRDTTSGGRLDLASNAACVLDHVKNENAAWLYAPRGTYRVLLDMYDACTIPQTHWLVTVLAAGQEPRLFAGVLGAGDQGGACYQGTTAVCGLEVATFEF
jgi:hypothetical protein